MPPCVHHDLQNSAHALAPPSTPTCSNGCCKLAACAQLNSSLMAGTYVVYQSCHTTLGNILYTTCSSSYHTGPPPSSLPCPQPHAHQAQSGAPAGAQHAALSHTPISVQLSCATALMCYSSHVLQLSCATALMCYSASTGWHLSPPLSTRDSSLACQLTAPGLHQITSRHITPHLLHRPSTHGLHSPQAYASTPASARACAPRPLSPGCLWAPHMWP
jgi:hypothetical protein